MNLKVFSKNYIVSSDGRVYSCARYYEQGRWLKPKIDDKDYECVDLCHNGKCKRYKVHRLVAELFIPNPLNLYTVNHIDGDKFNNDVSNLEWCTIGDNVRHAYKKHLNGAKRSKKSKNIYYDKSKKVWKVIFNVDKKRRRFGTFKNKKDAIIARNRARKQLGL